MKKVAVTFEKLREFQQASNFFLVKAKGNDKTKLAYAIGKISKQAQEYHNQYKSLCDDLQDKYQATNSDGHLVWDIVEGGQRMPTFKPDQHTAFRKKRDELYAEWKTKTFEIEPYIATEIPNDLSFGEVDAFSGLIIPEDYEAKQ
jgi:pyruvate formate-lyase activating enzyme-like uncharacterized protein